MQIPKDEAERVQLWIALGQQPGVSAWFTIWRVTHKQRVKAAAVRCMGRGGCTA